MFVIKDFFLCPHHEMAEGHNRVYLVHLCVCFGLCVPEPCPVHNLAQIMGFENNLAQMIIMTRRYVGNKNRHMSLGQRSRSQSTLKVCA